MSSNTYLLSTKDNPFNPHTQWVEWYTYDSSHNYNTPGLIDRIMVSSNELPEAQQRLEYDTAVDWIINNINSDFYVKVEPPTKNET